MVKRIASTRLRYGTQHKSTQNGWQAAERLILPVIPKR